MKPRRAFGLAELIVSMALMGLVLTLSIQLIFPLLRSLSRDAGRETVVRNSNRFLRQLRQDFRLAALPGVNHRATGSDWTLALVPRDWPTEDGVTTWSKSLILYHYSSQQKILWRNTVTPDHWPANQPSLEGKEPPMLDPDTFVSVAFASPDLQQLDAVVSATWAKVSSPLEIKIQPDATAPVLLSLDLSSELKTP